MNGLIIKEVENAITIFKELDTSPVAQFEKTALGAFYQWIKNYKLTLDYISVPLEEGYVEIVSVLKPDVPLVVEPQSLYDFLGRLFGHDIAYFIEEVAATDEGGEPLECGNYEMGQFLMTFYEARTKEEALLIYCRWQELIPLNNEVLCKVLEIMEFYLEEILNYFTLRNLKTKRCL